MAPLSKKADVIKLLSDIINIFTQFIRTHYFKD